MRFHRRKPNLFIPPGDLQGLINRGMDQLWVVGGGPNSSNLLQSPSQQQITYSEKARNLLQCLIREPLLTLLTSNKGNLFMYHSNRRL